MYLFFDTTLSFGVPMIKFGLNITYLVAQPVLPVLLSLQGVSVLPLLGVEDLPGLVGRLGVVEIPPDGLHAVLVAAVPLQDL